MASSITNGKKKIPKQEGKLIPEEIKALVKYVKMLAPKMRRKQEVTVFLFTCLRLFNKTYACNAEAKVSATVASHITPKGTLGFLIVEITVF